MPQTVLTKLTENIHWPLLMTRLGSEVKGQGHSRPLQHWGVQVQLLAVLLSVKVNGAVLLQVHWCLPFLGLELCQPLVTFPSAHLLVPSDECLRGEGLVWLIGAVVCLLAACRGSNCTLTRTMDGRDLRFSTMGSCQSTATCCHCKARLVAASLSK